MIEKENKTEFTEDEIERLYESYLDRISQYPHNLGERKSGKYLLATTFPDLRENIDTIIGGWRPLNLELEPFNFPKAEKIINERCSEMRDKSLGLWKLDGGIYIDED